MIIIKKNCFHGNVRKMISFFLLEKINFIKISINLMNNQIIIILLTLRLQTCNHIQ